MTEPAQELDAAQRAAEQARIRKERREAKIKAGGAARLNRITNLGGGIQRDIPAPPPQQQASEPKPVQPKPASVAPSEGANSDPEEGDVAQHHDAPQRTARIPPPTAGSNTSETALRQMMLGLDPADTLPPMGANEFARQPGMEGMGENDPMLAMMRQLMGGTGGPGGPGMDATGDNPFASTMRAMFGSGDGARPGPGGMMGDQFQQQQQPPPPPNPLASLWRIVHFLFTLGLAVWIGVTTSFSGTYTERQHALNQESYPHHHDGGASMQVAKEHIFYAFTGMELLLLSSRFLVEKLKPGSVVDSRTGILWSIAGFLPPEMGIKMWLETGLRYWQILGIVLNDLLVLVFGMGVCAWLRGEL